MDSSRAQSPKIDLDPNSKRCGNCLHCNRQQVRFYRGDKESLQDVARTIVNANPDSVELELSNDQAIRALIAFEQLRTEKVRCVKEKIWIHFLDAACFAWQPQRSLTPVLQPFA